MNNPVGREGECKSADFGAKAKITLGNVQRKKLEIIFFAEK